MSICFDQDMLYPQGVMSVGNTKGQVWSDGVEGSKLGEEILLSS